MRFARRVIRVWTPPRLRRGVGGRLHEQPRPEALHEAEVLHRMKWADEVPCGIRCNAGSVTATTVIPEDASAVVGIRKSALPLLSRRK